VTQHEPKLEAAEPSTERAPASARSPAPARKVSARSPEWQRKIEERLEAEEAAKIYQLNFWPDDKRAMPTDFVACALFAAVHNKNAPYLRGEQLASINGYTVSFTGKRLTQVHADILMGVAQLAREQSEGYVAVFRERAFLKLIGRHTGKSQRESLRQLIDDTMATAVRITGPDGKVSFSAPILMRSADKEDESGEGVFAIEIHRELCKLFTRGFAQIDLQQRRILMKQPLALWLQLYFSKFTKPISVKELHRLSGSTARTLFHFRANLKAALAELKNAGVLETWRLDAADVIHVEVPGKALPAQFTDRPPGAAQRILALAPAPQVSERAKETFRKRYPEYDCGQCLADWHTWLEKTGRSAEKPDAAFLGFAKSWAADRE
jgi:hypothetical protein